MNQFSNDYLFKIIKNGGEAVGKSIAMPPSGAGLQDQQIFDLVAFIRSLASPPYRGK